MMSLSLVILEYRATTKAFLSPLSTLQRTTSIYDNLLRDFPTLARPSNIMRPLKYNVAHHIVTTSTPVYARAQSLAPEHLQISRQELDHILELGIIRQSSSLWSSPPQMVSKVTPGDWRPCGNYRDLNNVTQDDQYPCLAFKTSQANLTS